MSKASTLLSIWWLTTALLACDGSSHRTTTIPAVTTPSSDTGPVSALPTGMPSGIERLAPTADCIQPTPSAQCSDGFCEVAPGCFVMGAPRGEPGAGRYSNIQVQVTLTHGFLISQTEVTRAQWLEAGWGAPKRNIKAGKGDCLEDNCPVGNVSFFDAVQYANWMSTRNQLPPCYELTGCSGEVGSNLQCSGVRWAAESPYTCQGYRLPMEAEWEYAARGGTISAFYGGESVSTQLGECIEEPGLEPIGWYCQNSGDSPHAVGGKAANAWGLYDMLGNVGEWCNDERDGLGYGQGPLVDPRGTFTPGADLLPPSSVEPSRVLRGGGFSLPSDTCTSAFRGGGGSGLGSQSVGFRLVKTSTSRW